VDKNILIPAVEMDYPALLENARKRNAGLLAAQQSKLVADREVTLARSGFFPLLSLGADYGYTDRSVRSSREDFEEDITTTSRDASVGLQLSWNLFNGNRDRIAVQNARIDQRSAELALRDAENRLAGAVQQVLVTFRNRMELVELEEQNVVAAQQNLERWTERYRLGTATSIEFRDAQVNLLRAQSAQIVARYQARITRLEIEKLVGNLRIE
jgi:outer membrane protein TolC